MFLDSHINEECCGCTACENICPKNAIKMITDSHGFSIPSIDENLCIHCDMCRNVCDFSKENSWSATIKAYGMHHKDKNILQSSRSGGAFYMLAETMIRNGGSVWGVAFDKSLNVVHTKVTSLDGLKRLQGSKYVQSELGNAFFQVRQDLIRNKAVMFSGTACQVAGLLRYLKKKKTDTTNLITVDIICQGVPSSKLFDDYKIYLETKYGKKLTAFNFRDSSRIGWKGHEESFRFEGEKKKHYSTQYANYYYHYMRKSCFHCQYAGLHRPADFTLGDFWGVNEKYPDFASSEGNSIMLVNSEKGLLFFDKAKINGDIIEVEVENCLQPRLKSSSQQPEGYDMFWTEYETKGSSYCIEKYGKATFKAKLIHLVKPILRKTGIKR